MSGLIPTIPPVTLADVLRTRIRQLMAAQGMTAQELSKEVGMKSKNWARGYLDGQHEMPLDTIEKVAAAFGVHALDLLDERSLKPIVGLGPNELAVARAFVSAPDEQIRIVVRRLLDLKEPREKDTHQRGRRGQTSRRAGEFPEAKGRNTG